MTAIEKFNELFCELGELCFKIKMVERPMRSFDFTSPNDQIISSDYFNEVKKEYPKTIRGFYLAIERKWCDSIACYLQENGEVIVVFLNKNMELEKTITYTSVKEVLQNRAGIIHFLLREWKLF